MLSFGWGGGESLIDLVVNKYIYTTEHQNRMQYNKINKQCRFCTLHFQGFFEKDPKGLLTLKDSQGNTIAHLVAASGNTEVFEVYYVQLVLG